ncbi:hypothetical protein B566_EDAN000695 [Ephemera danica]|nr:hypothetical protein B566_EDAN000695 [Ephemera danica]
MAIKFLLVLLFTYVTAGYSQQRSASSKVTGGTMATEGQVPWMISIQRKIDNGQFCGGSIIGQNWIVTAAQCSQIDMNAYQVRAGSLTYDTGGSVHDIVKIIVHENYNYNTLENDIAVWLILQSFNDNLRKPIALPTQNTPSGEGLSVIVAGWGATKYGGEPSKDLMTSTMSIISTRDCDENYSNFGGIPDNQICAGDSIMGQVDSCQFDTGGPLYTTVGIPNPELRGIVSWGYGCGLAEFPGVYTEVSKYRDWIKEQTGL